ncbi:sulfurtransferase TusA family protein, partial [Planctomycetota bacterium]
ILERGKEAKRSTVNKDIRTTQLQNLLITGAAAKDIDIINSELKNLSINVFGHGKPEVVTCTGASTCKLGLCLSRGLSEAISNRLSQFNLSDTTIRISGCPNSCGHHYIADIGFQGKAKRVKGKLLPCYDVLTGAKTAEGVAHLAERIGTVPARRIPDLLVYAAKNGKIEKDRLQSLIVKYSLNDEEQQLPDDYYYDWDSDERFSLAGRGPGECGAGVMDVIKLDIDEATDVIKATPASNESVYKALVAASRALLVIFGLEPKKDREIFAAFRQHFIEPGLVKQQSLKLINNALDWKMGDIDSIIDLLPQVIDLINRIEELFLSLDSSLNVKAEPVVQEKIVETDKTKSHTINLRGIACPLNFVKAKLELEKIEIGDILEILLDKGEPVLNVPASFAEQGQEVLEVKNIGDHYCVNVQRKK